MQLVAGCDLNPLARGIMTSPAAVMRLKVLLFKVGETSRVGLRPAIGFGERKQARFGGPRLRISARALHAPQPSCDALIPATAPAAPRSVRACALPRGSCGGLVWRVGGPLLVRNRGVLVSAERAAGEGGAAAGGGRVAGAGVSRGGTDTVWAPPFPFAWHFAPSRPCT